MTDRGDMPIWSAYFNHKDCSVSIKDGLFQITPHSPGMKKYFIKGGEQCISYSPGRWNQSVRKKQLINFLESAEKSIYSQHGEDGVLEYLIKKTCEKHKYIVEFGAFDGIAMSNSRHFIKNKGWSALLIEADKKLYTRLECLYADHEKVALRNVMVTEKNINELFKGAGVPEDFDILSIDIDSIDYYVWEALTDYMPGIVIIEYNSSIPPDVEYIVSKDKMGRYTGTANEGASILSFYKLGQKKGYQLIYGELSGANLFFVHQSLLQNLNIEDITPEDAYQPPQFGLLAGGPAPNGRGYQLKD